jgi:hypothetical protein
VQLPLDPSAVITLERRIPMRAGTASNVVGPRLSSNFSIGTGSSNGCVGSPPPLSLAREDARHDLAGGPNRVGDPLRSHGQRTCAGRIAKYGGTVSHVWTALGMVPSPIRTRAHQPGCRLVSTAARSAGPVLGISPERASRRATVLSGALGESVALCERATTEPAAASTNPLTRTRYFTVTVKHSLVRTVPSVPTTRKLTSNCAPSTNRGKVGGPRSTS